MKTVHIDKGHEGYPSGRKRAFRAGEVVEAPNDYADLICGEGKRLAHEVEPKKALPAPKKDGDAA